MELRRAAEGAALAGIDPFFVDLMRQIPASADPEGSDAARERIFSRPGDEKNAEFQDEWGRYVEPELRELFESALDCIRRDLENFVAEDAAAGELSTYSLLIPREHLEKWLNGLNQARLVLAARHGLLDTDARAVAKKSRARILCQLQIDFYGSLQDAFIGML